MEFISQEQATPLSLHDSAFWPLTNIVEMVADGNCGFRAVAHSIQGQESVWPEVRQRLLDQLNSDPTGYLRGLAITSGGEISLLSLQANLMHFHGPTWDRSKWF